MDTSILRSKNYFEAALFHNPSEEVSSFFSESLYNSYRRNNYSGIAGVGFHTGIVSVAILDNNTIELGIDCALNPNQNICQSLHSDACRKTNLLPHRISVKPVKTFQPHFRIDVGSKVAHMNLAARNEYGSLGGFLLPEQEGRNPVIVSNNHVLANSNNAAIGDPIYVMDSSPYHVGSLLNFKPISLHGGNHIDLALGKLEGQWTFTDMHYVGYRDPYIGEQVHKTGARTGYTIGTVRSRNYSTRINYGSYNAVFLDQIEVLGNGFSSFSAGGDSGSSIKSLDDGAWVGLLFAGNGASTIANHQIEVIKQLRLWGINIK